MAANYRGWSQWKHDQGIKATQGTLKQIEAKDLSANAMGDAQVLALGQLKLNTQELEQLCIFYTDPKYTEREVKRLRQDAQRGHT